MAQTARYAPTNSGTARTPPAWARLSVAGAAPGSIIAAIMAAHTAMKKPNEPSGVAVPMFIPVICQTETTQHTAASPSVAARAAAVAADPAPARAVGLRPGPAAAMLFTAASIGALVGVVPPPPGVGRVLRIALGRVLPLLLPPEHGHVQVAPGAAECLVATAVDEVGAEHLVAVAEERVRAVPLVHAEVGVEVVGHRVPGMRPAHLRLQAGDVSLRRPRGVGERGVPGVQVRDVADLVGHQGAAGARVVGPAVHAGLEEGAVDDKLAAALEQAGQAHLAVRPVEHVVLLDRQPRHPPAFGRQRIPGAGHLLFLDEQPLARGLPLLCRDDRRGLHGGVSLSVRFSVFRAAGPRQARERPGRGGLSTLQAGCPSRGPARPGTAAPPASARSATGTAPGAAPPARPLPGRSRPAAPGAWRSPAA